MFDEGRADRVIANRGCWKLGTQSLLKLGITQTGLASNLIKQKDRKDYRYSCKCQQLAKRFKRKKEERKEGSR